MSTAPPGPPSRLRLTAYAAAQLLLAVPALVLFVLVRRRRRRCARDRRSASRSCCVTVPAMPLDRRPAPRDGRPGARAPRSRRRTARTGPEGSCPARAAGPRDPMTWRDLAWLAGRLHRRASRSSLLVRAAVRAGRDRRAVVVRRSGRSCGPRSAIDRWLLALRAHRGRWSSGSQVLTETRAETRRPLGRRAAPDRARPARRRPGPAGRAGDEPRHGRRDCSSRDPEPARRLLPRPARPRPARPSATCAPWSAASTRRCWPTAGCRRGRRRWRSTWRSRSTVDGRRRRPAAGAGRVGRLLRGRRVPGQRRQALRRRARRGSRSPTTTACCAWSSATTAAAAPIPAAGTGLLGVMRRLAAFDGTMRVSSPAGGPDARHPGGAVRLVLAEDHALLRDGLIRLLEAQRLHDRGRRRQRARARPRRCSTRSADVAVVDVRLPPTFTDEGLRAAIAVPRGPAGLPGAGAVAVRRAALRPRAARQRRGRGRLPAQGPGRRRRASSSTPYAGSPPAAPCSTPRSSPP